MQIIRFKSGSKYLYCILLVETGKKYGQYTDKNGHTRFQAWAKREHAERIVNIIEHGLTIETYFPLEGDIGPNGWAKPDPASFLYRTWDHDR
jgi:hypothetical protein